MATLGISLQSPLTQLLVRSVSLQTERGDCSVTVLANNGLLSEPVHAHVGSWRGNLQAMNSLPPEPLGTMYLKVGSLAPPTASLDTLLRQFHATTNVKLTAADITHAAPPRWTTQTNSKFPSCFRRLVKHVLLSRCRLQLNFADGRITLGLVPTSVLFLILEYAAAGLDGPCQPGAPLKLRQSCQRLSLHVEIQRRALPGLVPSLLRSLLLVSAGMPKYGISVEAPGISDHGMLLEQLASQVEPATALLDVAVRDTSMEQHPAVDGIVSELYPYQVVAPAADMHVVLSCFLLHACN